MDSVAAPGSDVHVATVHDATQISEYTDSHLAGLAAEFLKPPAAFTGPPAPPIHIKSLPAVPGALFMVLTGFLCVSLVKDRRVWLAALAGLLWLGQAGIQAVPQLALRLSHRNHTEQQFSAELTYPYYLENSNRLRSDIEGTQYIGLLHHLAGIPDSTMLLLQRRLLLLQSRLSFVKPRLSFLRRQESSQTEDEFGTPQSAITRFSSCPIPLLKCLASRAEQFIRFSPAFIFDNLARGPPKLT